MKRIFSAMIALLMLFSLFTAFPAVTSAASMTDEDFFAKFNYSDYPALSEVESYASSGDYTSAKKALLEYFKERHAEGKITGFGISESDENYSMAVLPMRNILTGPYEFDMWEGEFTVTSSSFSNYETDITDRISQELGNGAVSFMLFAGEKQRFPVYVQSKEAGAGVAPKLEVTFEKDGVEETVTITADNDTYISSGNTSTTYGSEEQLVIKEDGSGSDSTGSNTRRTYINFPLDSVANSTILSAKLIVSAAYAADCDTGDKTVLIINIGDTIWSEDSITWGGTRGSIYSYQDADSPTWAASAPNADSEYHNVTSRFWFGKPMAYEYLSYLKDPEAYNETHPYSDVYPGEDFGPKLVSLMSAFATQRDYGYTRTLETGERLNRWVDIVDALLETDVFDTRLDEFCNIISFMWGDCNWLNGKSISDGSVWWSNWRIVANAGFFKGVEFFPEFSTHSTWRTKVEGNVEYTLDLLYNDDFSFTEAGPSYAAWCAKLFGDCVRAANMSGSPLSAITTEKVKLIARNALESYYPNGYDTNIGDSNYRDQLYYFQMLDETFNETDKVIHSYATGSDQGAEYLTHYYEDSNSAYMRNSWDPDEAVYVNFTNSAADGHAHPDSNQVLLYAYGQPLLVDSGRYSYSSTNSIYNTLRTAESHNTVELVDGTLNSHSSAANGSSLLYTIENDSFDFTASEQHGYSGVSHTRNVFFARSGFAIVTDYVEGSSSGTYRQNWHFLPSSNAEASGNSISTNFYKKPNVTVVAASADNASVRDGYHSADYGLVASSKYASFEKSGSTVKFDTILYPTKEGESVSVEADDLADGDNTKAAVKFTIDGDEAYYYVRNTSSSDGVFGSYETDAKVAYVSDSEYMLADGKSITGLIEAPNTITSVAAVIDGDALAINGQDLVASTDKTEAIAIYAPDAASVTLNGKTVSFVSDNGFVYAAASTALETVTVTEKVYPSKDGFVAYATGNEGTTNTDLIQAASSSWNNRNAYMAFDLSDYEGATISNVTLNMKMKENSNAGTMHFYYLDYGTWTRDNLSFVLDSTKMPSHGTSSKASFTGYSYRWSGSASGVSNENWVSFSPNLTSYLSNGGSYKFTWAMLSESGSAKFYAGTASAANLPYLEITSTKTVGEAANDPTITINKYADGVLKSSTEVSAPLHSTYLYDGDEQTTSDGVTYYLDGTDSKLSCVVAESGNVINAYYISATDVTVSFKATDGTFIKKDVKISVPPSSTVTYSAKPSIITDSGVYTVVGSPKVTLSSSAGDVVIEYIKTYEFTEDNLVTDGGFEDSDGNFSWGTWMSPNGSNGYFKDSCEDWFYKVNADTNEAVLYTKSLETDDYALGTRWSDGEKGLCSLANFIKVEKGETYYVGFNYKHVESNVVPTYICITFSTDNTNFSDGTETVLTLANATTDWQTGSTMFTAPSDGYVYFHFRWLGSGSGNTGNGPFWYFDDFAVAKANEISNPTVTLDGKEVVTDGTISLGENSALPEGIAGYLVKSEDGDSYLASAGDLAVEGGEVITSVPVNVSLVSGAQVRYGNGVDKSGKVSTESGLRFIATVDRTSVLDGFVSSYGMDVQAMDSDSVIDIPAEKYQDEENTTFTAAITNLIVSNYNRPFTAHPYVIVKYSDGSEQKVYSPDTITRSIYQTSAGLLQDDTLENTALYNVLNAYVNMVGIRLTMTKDSQFTMRDEGKGAYTGDILFDVTSEALGNGSYRITVSPLTDIAPKLQILSYWDEFIRINNNHSSVSEWISESENVGECVTFIFTPVTE